MPQPIHHRPGFLAYDWRGALFVTDGIVHYRTACCGASGKGTGRGTTGVSCRACRTEVSIDYGRGWLATDQAAWDQYLADMAGHWTVLRLRSLLILAHAVNTAAEQAAAQTRAEVDAQLAEDEEWSTVGYDYTRPVGS
jgi:hypothetical protein